MEEHQWPPKPMPHLLEPLQYWTGSLHLRETPSSLAFSDAARSCFSFHHSNHLSASLAGLLPSSHPLNVPLKISPSDRFLPDILSYRIHSQASPLLLPFLSTPTYCASDWPQIAISCWVSCSIPDATYSKPNPFSFLANLIRILSPSHPPRLKTQASSMTLFTPQQIHSSSKSVRFYFPSISKWNPLSVATAALFTRASAFPRLLTKAPHWAVQPLCPNSPVWDESDASLTPQSPTQMGHSLGIKILYYVTVSNPLQPLSLAFSTSPIRLQGCQSYFPLFLPVLLSPQHNWTFSLERSCVFLLLNLCSFSFFPWNALAPFPSIQMLLISQVLLYKASKSPSPHPAKWTLSLLCNSLW